MVLPLPALTRAVIVPFAFKAAPHSTLTVQHQSYRPNMNIVTLNDKKTSLIPESWIHRSSLRRFIDITGRIQQSSRLSTDDSAQGRNARQPRSAYCVFSSCLSRFLANRSLLLYHRFTYFQDSEASPSRDFCQTEPWVTIGRPSFCGPCAASIERRWRGVPG